MAVHGGKPKIRHKNIVDGIAENGGQKKIYIYIIINNQVKKLKKFHEFIQ